MKSKLNSARQQRGISLFGLMFWAILIGAVALLGMKVLPTLNEYFTVKRTVEKIAASGATTVPEIRTAFDKQKEIEFSIKSISGKDLEVTKENDKVVIKFAYQAEVEIVSPVFILMKYEGRSK
jgi:hypothetical protein